MFDIMFLFIQFWIVDNDYAGSKINKFFGCAFGFNTIFNIFFVIKYDLI